MSTKLLLADDSLTIQRVIELTFSGEDVQVVAVSNGEEAIARIPTEKPDIILADIGMPKRSGYEVSAFVKHHPELANIPVLLLAGAFEPVDEAKAQEARCDGVLVKPFEPQHVITRVRELISAAKRPPTQPVADVPQPEAALPSPTPIDHRSGDDRQPTAEELLELGGEDLLPREGLLPQFDDAPSASPLIGLDNSLDDYFDKLDEAFAIITAPARSDGGPESRTPRPDGPVLDRDLESFDEAPAVDVKPRAGFDGEDPFAGFDDIRVEDSPRVPTLDDLLADMPPPAGPVAVIDFPPAPAAVPPSIPVPPRAPTRVEGPPIEPPTAPSNGRASGRSIIADAFSALLAVEQGEPGAVPPRLGGNGSAPIVTDTLIDDVARRVIQRLALGTSDQMQVVVKEIVSGVAERLVREEIDRIRRNAPRS